MWERKVFAAVDADAAETNWKHTVTPDQGDWNSSSFSYIPSTKILLTSHKLACWIAPIAQWKPTSWASLNYTTDRPLSPADPQTGLSRQKINRQQTESGVGDGDWHIWEIQELINTKTALRLNNIIDGILTEYVISSTTIISDQQKKLFRNMSIFVVIIVPGDALAPLDPKTFAATVMIKVIFLKGPDT